MKLVTLGAGSRMLRATVVAAATALTAGAIGAGPAVAEDLNSITSFDGTNITFYWFPAVGLAPGQTAPTVLQGPGFGGQAQSNPDASSSSAIPGVGDLRRAGYNVLTWNPRGISPSGGEAQLNNPDFEGRDVSALISWVSERPEAKLDAAGDPRVGMTGGSYGGGIQFSTAAIDKRIDTIVPVIAWHSLQTSLYKADTIKSSWVNALLVGATRPGNTFSPSILKGREQARKGTTFSKEVVDFARDAGPDRVLSQVTAPTLILQGTIDNLFPPSEAIENYKVLKANGVPVKMVWFCGGHGVCLTKGGESTLPLQQTWLWLDKYLKGDTSVDTGPGFTWIDQRGKYRSEQTYSQPTGKLRAKSKGVLALRKAGGSGPYAGKLPSGISPTFSLVLRPTIPAPAKRSVGVKVTCQALRSGGRNAEAAAGVQGHFEEQEGPGAGTTGPQGQGRRQPDHAVPTYVEREEAHGHRPARSREPVPAQGAEGRVADRGTERPLQHLPQRRQSEVLARQTHAANAQGLSRAHPVHRPNGSGATVDL